MTITLFIPCYVDALYPQVGLSLIRIFERLGHRVTYHPELVCCGQPAFNAGHWEESRQVARRVLRRLRGAEVVVVPSGSCAATLKVFYRELFVGKPEAAEAAALGARTHEFASFLVDALGAPDLGSEFPHRVAFHGGCHGMRELGVRRQPRTLLESVRGLSLVEAADAEVCCGFGGLFSVKFPAIATAMGENKCAAILESGAEYLVSNDSSCLMHLQGLLARRSAPLPTMHLAEVLARF